MTKAPAQNKVEARALEADGDRLAAEGLFKEALEKYKASEALDSERPEVYRKLIATHEKAKADGDDRDWETDDVADLVTWTMREQELETPRLSYLHRHLSGLDREADQLIVALMQTEDPLEEGQLLSRLEALGERAVKPLLYFFLNFKHSRADPSPLPPAA